MSLIFDCFGNGNEKISGNYRKSVKYKENICKNLMSLKVLNKASIFTFPKELFPEILGKLGILEFPRNITILLINNEDIRRISVLITNIMKEIHQ